MYEFFVVIIPELLGAGAIAVGGLFGIGFAARAIGAVRRREAYVRRLETFHADALDTLAAITVHRSIDAAPEFLQQQMTRLLATNPRQEIEQ